MTPTKLILRSMVYVLPVALICWFFYWLIPTSTEFPYLTTALFWWYQLIPLALLILSFSLYKLYLTWVDFAVSCKQEHCFHVNITIAGLFGAFTSLSGLCFLASALSFIVGGLTLLALFVTLRLSKPFIAKNVWHLNGLLLNSRS